MPIGASGKALIRLGVVTLMLAAFAAGWELLARQAPGTPLYIEVLPGPIASLRELATAVGLLLAFAGLTQSWARGAGEGLLVVLVYAGTLLALFAQIYAAANGMNAVQTRDLRADALPVFLIKQGGLLLLTLGLLEHGRRLLFRDPPPPVGGGSLRDQAILKGRGLDPRPPTGSSSGRQLDPRGHGN